METLFLKLVNLSITAGWLVLAVLAVRLIFPKTPRWIFCLLWGLVGIRLLCPFSIESAFSLIPSAQPIPESILTNQVPHIQSGIGAIDAIVNPVLEDTLTPSPGTSVNPVQVWTFVLSLLWAFGAVLILLYGIISTALLRYRLRTATLLRDNIRQTDQLATPFVLGIIRPKIYVPYNLSDADLPYVLAHEQTHIRRHDHWWKPLGFALLAVYWFNPLLWIAYVLLCRDIEAACDEKVIREMEEDARLGYSTALLRCSSRPGILAACPLAFGEVGVKQRIKRVMQYKKPAVILVAVVLVIAVVAGVCLLTNPKSGVANNPDAPVLDGETNPGAENTPALVAWVEPKDPDDLWNLPADITQELPEFPGTVFHFTSGEITAVQPDGTEKILIQGMPIWNAYFQDINGDGIPELCATTSFGSGIVDDRILCWESTADTVYTLADRMKADYRLQVRNGVLFVEEKRYEGDVRNTGRLVLRDGVLMMERADMDTLASLYLTPGNCYVSWECLYLSPASDVFGTGDTGCRYEIREDGFAQIAQISGEGPNAVTVPAEGEPLEGRETGKTIPVSDWTWQPFPWEDQAWKDLFMSPVLNMADLPNQTQDLRYLPLGGDDFLLLADGDLLIAHTFAVPTGARQIWSVYSLILEDNMGSADWALTDQVYNSVRPAFPFRFDESAQVYATCSSGQLIDFDGASTETDAPSGYSLDFPAGHTVWWTPYNPDGTIAREAAIQFSYNRTDADAMPAVSGTLYVRAGDTVPGTKDVIYTARIVGTGLHLEDGTKATIQFTPTQD